AIVLTFQPVVLDCHVLAFNGAGFVEAFAERGHIARVDFGRPESDKPDHRHRWLLRPRRERPRGRCAAEERDEVATSHSITSSARPDSGSGRLMPSALAVLGFRNSSTFDTCCTGSSFGFSPLGI